MKKYYSIFAIAILFLASCGNSEMDKFLNEYEKYVKENIEFAKKINEGEISATSKEYIEHISKQAEFLNKCSELDQSKMTKSQWKRYMEINHQMLEDIE